MKGGNAVIAEGIFPEGQAYIVRRLSDSDIPSVLRLQQMVVTHLADPGRLAPLSEEEYYYITGGKGILIGVFVEGELIAFRGLVEPEITDEHLGLDAGLPEQELEFVMYQEISNVHPDWRGLNLQQRMAQWAMSELESMDHPYKYICATVAPFNVPSLKDKFSQGMEIAGLKPKYGGHLRYIFLKQLDGSQGKKEESVMHPMGDTEGQQELLKQGYRGIRMEVIDGDFFVEYVK